MFYYAFKRRWQLVLLICYVLPRCFAVIEPDFVRYQSCYFCEMTSLDQASN